MALFFTILPPLLFLAAIIIVWRWCSTMLREVKRINRRLDRIAASLDTAK